MLKLGKDFFKNLWTPENFTEKWKASFFRVFRHSGVSSHHWLKAFCLIYFLCKANVITFQRNLSFIVLSQKWFVRDFFVSAWRATFRIWMFFHGNYLFFAFIQTLFRQKNSRKNHFRLKTLRKVSLESYELMPYRKNNLNQKALSQWDAGAFSVVFFKEFPGFKNSEKRFPS